MVPATLKLVPKKGIVIADNDGDRAAGNDLIDAEFPVEMFFKPGFYREVRIRIEGDKEHVHIEAAGKACGLDEQLRSYILYAGNDLDLVEHGPVHQKVRRFAGEQCRFCLGLGAFRYDENVGAEPVRADPERIIDALQKERCGEQCARDDCYDGKQEPGPRDFSFQVSECYIGDIHNYQ